MAVSVICALFPILFENANAQVVDLTNAGVILTTKMPVVSRYADVLVNGLFCGLFMFKDLDPSRSLVGLTAAPWSCILYRQLVPF